MVLFVQDHSGAGGVWNNKILAEWLKSYHDTAEGYDKATDMFLRSCAGDGHDVICTLVSHLQLTLYTRRALCARRILCGNIHLGHCRPAQRQHLIAPKRAACAHRLWSFSWACENSNGLQPRQIAFYSHSAWLDISTVEHMIVSDVQRGCLLYAG
jgi:hypothetical protein